LEQLLKAVLCRAKTVSNGVDVNVECLRNLDLGHLLELRQDEHLTLLIVELLEKVMQELDSLCVRSLLERRTTVRALEAVGIDGGGRLIGAARGTTDVAGDRERESKEPRLEIRALEFSKLGMDHQKDFLHGVFGAGGWNTQTDERSVDELRIGIVELGQRGVRRLDSVEDRCCHGSIKGTVAGPSHKEIDFGAQIPSENELETHRSASTHGGGLVNLSNPL